MLLNFLRGINLLSPPWPPFDKGGQGGWRSQRSRRGGGAEPGAHIFLNKKQIEGKFKVKLSRKMELNQYLNLTRNLFYQLNYFDFYQLLNYLNVYFTVLLSVGDSYIL